MNNLPGYEDWLYERADKHMQKRLLDDPLYDEEDDQPEEEEG